MLESSSAAFFCILCPMAFTASAISASSPTDSVLPASQRAERCWPDKRREPRAVPNPQSRPPPLRTHALVAAEQWSGSPYGITAKHRPNGPPGTTAHDRLRLPRYTRQTPDIHPTVCFHAGWSDTLRPKSLAAPVLAVPQHHLPANHTGFATPEDQPWAKLSSAPHHSSVCPPSQTPPQS